jgi:hypothetical protein
MNIGDRAQIVGTGEEPMGHICGIMTGESYYNIMSNKTNLGRWDSLFPGWKDRNVIILKHDYPTRYISFTEYVNYLYSIHGNSLPHEEYLRKVYERDTFFVSISAQPEEGVVLL